ncbi:MAG TPA: hypothetical protein VHB25_16020 [Gemmatimonadaceae bacterium]|nr:hypothetical protein [Gemmatimonadaceae bacterium]
MSSHYRAALGVALMLATGCGESRTGPLLPGTGISRIAICCLSPRDEGLNLGAKLPLYVFALGSRGDTLGIAPAAAWWHGGSSAVRFPIAWWSSDSSIASVDSIGVVTSRAIGATYIHARSIALGDTLVDSVALKTTDYHAASKSPVAP